MVVQPRMVVQPQMVVQPRWNSALGVWEGNGRTRHDRNTFAAVDLRLRFALLEGRLSRRGAVCRPREWLEAALRTALDRPPRHARCTGAGGNGADGRAARGAQASITRRRSKGLGLDRGQSAVWSAARRPKLALQHGLTLP
jgi:hypothetical protein